MTQNIEITIETYRDSTLPLNTDPPHAYNNTLNNRQLKTVKQSDPRRSSSTSACTISGSDAICSGDRFPRATMMLSVSAATFEPVRFDISLSRRSSISSIGADDVLEGSYTRENNVNKTFNAWYTTTVWRPAALVVCCA